MEFNLTIACDNDAFYDDSLRAEVARILRDAAKRVEQLPISGKLYDANGNTVGSYRFEEE